MLLFVYARSRETFGDTQKTVEETIVVTVEETNTGFCIRNNLLRQ